MRQEVSNKYYSYVIQASKTSAAVETYHVQTAANVGRENVYNILPQFDSM